MIIGKNTPSKADIEVIGDWTGNLPTVRIDTREIQDGDLFWALAGTRSDGHDYIDTAFEEGSAICAVSRMWYDRYGEIFEGKSFFVMNDTLEGLQRLAAEVRGTIGATIIAVTGSAGKTTTRELITAGLETIGKVSQTPGNKNNHIGLPLTLLNLKGDEQFVVLEMGANHMGEIEILCKIARPSMGLITNIGDAHMGEFGSTENIQKAKGELFRFLGDNGIILVNLDDERVLSIAANYKNLAGYTISEFPADFHHPVYKGNVTGMDTWSRITMNIEGIDIRMSLPGKHFASAAMAAYAVAMENGAESVEALNAIAQVQPLEGRGRIYELNDGVELMDETYNANPASVLAALETISNWNGPKVAVIGDIYELGEFEEDEHRRIGRLPMLEELDAVILIGEKMSAAFEEAEINGYSNVEWYDGKDIDQVLTRLLEIITPGMGIVIKASRALQLERLVERLKTELA